MTFRPKETSIWKPPEQILISEWAEKYRVLDHPAEEKGPLRLRRTPYLTPILDACLEPNVETIVFCKPAQIAGTEAMLNIIGYYTHQDPCPIMLIMADEDTAKYMSDVRLRPLYASSEALSEFIIDGKFNQGEISLSNRAYVAMGWASSVAKLASRPIKIIIFDEVDKPGYYVTTREASPISLGIERTETFFNRKILILSTPTTDEGNITIELMSCDVIYDWHVPCSYCGQRQPLRWSRKHAKDFPDSKYRAEDGIMHELGEVVWEGGHEAIPEQIEKAGYKCGECRKVWNTIEKNLAVEQGKMVARKEVTHPPKKVGFHVNRLYSLLGKSGNLPKLVDEWIKCQSDFRKLQGFLNSTLAVPWTEVAIKPAESTILERCCSLPPLIVPQEAVALTCGIDVQLRGFYFTVWAWSHDLESWMIHYGFLPTWDDVSQLIFEHAYQIQNSDKSKHIWRAVIDTGGGISEDESWSKTEEIYTWIRNNGRGRAWGIKGMARPTGQKIRHSVIDRMPGMGGKGQIIPGGLVLWLLDTDQLKEDFFWRLGNQDADPQPMHFHNETDRIFAQHLMAEEKRRGKDGKWAWVQIHKANHYLDASLYAHSAADPQFMGGVRVLKIGDPLPPRKESPSDNKSGWLGGANFMDHKKKKWL